MRSSQSRMPMVPKGVAWKEDALFTSASRRPIALGGVFYDPRELAHVEQVALHHEGRARTRAVQLAGELVGLFPGAIAVQRDTCARAVEPACDRRADTTRRARDEDSAILHAIFPPRFRKIEV